MESWNQCYKNLRWQFFVFVFTIFEELLMCFNDYGGFVTPLPHDKFHPKHISNPNALMRVNIKKKALRQS